MPNCEGWVTSQDGNANDSIAALTKTSSSCTNSVGGSCTIDVIDYWDTPTDPYSKGWPANPGYASGSTGAGAGGSGVIMDSTHILDAGCDLAAATGGAVNRPPVSSPPRRAGGRAPQFLPRGAVAAHPEQTPPVP